jgi:DNA polymerase I-like protein with 3'-5' exonuclease and polymerase domains
MEQIVTLDFETFYSSEFSLTKCTTEEYIKDRRFQVIGVAVKINDGEIHWHTGTHAEIQVALDKIDWKQSGLICHNTMFDGAILGWIFNIYAAHYFDTLCIARALHGTNVGGSLKYLAEKYNLGKKGTEVLDAKGKRLEDFTPTELSAYASYCVNDVQITFDLFRIIALGFPESEHQLIDITLRMFIQPQLRVDDALLIERLEEVRDEKAEMLEGLMARLECDTNEAVRKKLASNKQFAELLEELGVPCPMKESITTGKQAPALAKTDLGFIELQEHDDPFVQELCAVRLGTKSTIEESRVERFIDIGARHKGWLPIPLKFYGAHTGRWSGMEKVNFQNLPSRDAKKKALKKSVIPPDGQVVLNVDSSQIEARILVWLAGQEDVTAWFAEGRDTYCEFASKVYGRTITKADAIERFVGKTCTLGLGFGTGWRKLQHTLKTSPPGQALPDDECKRLVKVYRELNHKVIGFWGACDRALEHIANWPEGLEPYYLGEHRCVIVDRHGIKLPNGLYIYYPELYYDTSEAKSGFVYKSRRGKVNIWGGAMTENIVQALARIVIGEQMVAINARYRPALTVHDAIICVAPESEKDEALSFLMEEMGRPPIWATELPIACEGDYANTYGDC